MNEPQEASLPCDGKLAFDTQKQAVAAATTAAWQHADAAGLKAYHCRHCQLWHLSSSSGHDD